MEHTHEETSCTTRDMFRWFTVALLACLVIVSIVVAVKLFDKPENQVSVNGVGRVSFVADKAKVTIGIQIDKAETAEAALKELTTRANSISEAIAQLNITEENIYTSNYSIYPHYDYATDGTGSSYVSGYDANQQIVITIDNIHSEENRIANVVTAAAKVGSNQVLGIVYDISNVEELKQQARLLALEDARKKAEQTSNALGVPLGKITGWWDNVVNAPGVNQQSYYYGGGYGGGGSSIPSGNQEITVEASVTYEIEKK